MSDKDINLVWIKVVVFLYLFHLFIQNNSNIRNLVSAKLLSKILYKGFIVHVFIIDKNVYNNIYNANNFKTFYLQEDIIGT